jgi:soluble lytic murein transglycosylase-like protein
MVIVTGNLLTRLKKQNPELYAWFVSRSIDLQNLGKYTSAIAMAISLAVSQPVIAARQDSQPLVEEEGQLSLIQVAELKGKNDLERAVLVWQRYGHLIRHSAAEYDLDPNLIFATIMVESGGNTYAIRQEPRIHDASYGLGQILYTTARGIGYRGKPEGLFDPAINIDLIACYHKRNFDRYTELNPTELTVAYNTGSPYKRPHPGHLKKFEKWYHSLANLEIDLT